MKKQLFGKIGAISSKLAAPSRKISMKRPSLAVSGPNPSELWKRYWKKVVDIIFWGCTFSAQLIYWVRKFEVLSPTQKTRFVDLGVVKAAVRGSGTTECASKNDRGWWGFRPKQCEPRGAMIRLNFGDGAFHHYLNVMHRPCMGNI